MLCVCRVVCVICNIVHLHRAHLQSVGTPYMPGIRMLQSTVINFYSMTWFTFTYYENIEITVMVTRSH